MRRAIAVVVLLSAASILHADDLVSVPWSEFKKVYRESIERDIMRTQAEPEKKKEPLVYTIDEAAYCIVIGKDTARGDVLITGRIISGAPAPIPLFGRDIVVAKTMRIAGGCLLAEQEASRGILFLPDGKTNDFQLVLSFLARPKDDSKSQLLSFAIPPAMKNSLALNLPADTAIVEDPGIPDAGGVYHFSAAPSLTVRFLDKKRLSAPEAVDIDMFSRIRLQGKRAVITTAFVPVRMPADGFVLRVSKDAQYLSSSLKASWIMRKDDNSFVIKLPADEKGIFYVQLAVDEPDGTNGIATVLPVIERNGGKEGDFVLDAPDDGQITPGGRGLVSDIPIARLGKELASAAGKNRSFMHIQPGEVLHLDVQRFIPVATPPLVLDSQYFFTSFDENGDILSTVVMEVPPETGPHLKLKAVAGAEIWSLTVNGKNRKVYGNDSSTWIVPLDAGEVSRVELAVLHKGAKLGLQGRLEVLLPETGLPSRSARVGIAIPERVQLMSIEGPVSPDPDKSWQTPATFVGKPYFFSRSFYKGEGMKLAVSYKEPVKNP